MSLTLILSLKTALPVVILWQTSSALALGSMSSRSASLFSTLAMRRLVDLLREGEQAQGTEAGQAARGHLRGRGAVYPHITPSDTTSSPPLRPLHPRAISALTPRPRESRSPCPTKAVTHRQSLVAIRKRPTRKSASWLLTT